jgi:hypothetical protein
MPGERGDSTDHASDRRSNLTLRELLDEMVELARHVSKNSARLSPAELAYARERMEWLADEIWESATQGETR